jgi:hypothetical protein
VPQGSICCILEGAGGAGVHANSSNRGPAMKVKDAMHKGVDWVSPDTPVTELRN